MKFRKKPVVIEATQWFMNGDHPKDYEGHTAEDCGEPWGKIHNWEGQIVRRYRHPGVPADKACEKCGHFMEKHGWIDTLEGGHIVCPGDWIITGVQGEHYPCKPDIFESTYEPVEGDE